jgi:hypothetical protein
MRPTTVVCALALCALFACAAAALKETARARASPPSQQATAETKTPTRTEATTPTPTRAGTQAPTAPAPRPPVAPTWALVPVEPACDEDCDGDLDGEEGLETDHGYDLPGRSSPDDVMVLLD